MKWDEVVFPNLPNWLFEVTERSAGVFVVRVRERTGRTIEQIERTGLDDEGGVSPEQLKLLADAARDLVMSPVSVVVFALDALRKPRLEDSLYLKLMLLGRRSDRLINLFDEHRDAGHYTVDQAVEELEQMVVGAKRD